MSESDLGPKPDARIERGEPNPGGVDSTPDSDGVDNQDTHGAEPVARDLDPNSNPAVEDALPDEMKQREDTDTKATKGEDSDSEKEDPA